MQSFNSYRFWLSFTMAVLTAGLCAASPMTAWALVESGSKNFEGASENGTTATTADGNFVVSTTNGDGIDHQPWDSYPDEVYIYDSDATTTTQSFTIAATGSASPDVFELDSIDFTESPAGYGDDFIGNIVITGNNPNGSDPSYSFAASSFPADFKIDSAGAHTVSLNGTDFDGVNIDSFTVSYTPNNVEPWSFGTSGFSISVEMSYLFWSDNSKDHINRADLDGNNAVVILEDLPNPQGMDVDTSAGKIYWADYGTDDIRRANLDGSDSESLISSLSPRDIALDTNAGKMYWTDLTSDDIRRANLDGSDLEILVTGVDYSYGIALDTTAGKMYWTDITTDAVYRADLDGTNPETLVTGLDDPSGIDLDTAAGKMYWLAFGSDDIRRANLNGSNPEIIVTGLTHAFGISLDTNAGKMYWSDTDGDYIKRADLDGSNPETLVTGMYNCYYVHVVSPSPNTATADLSVTTHGNETGPVSIVYTVTLDETNDTGSAITFTTSFTSGTAAAGSDYNDVSGAATISVADGSTTGTLSVPVTNDSLFENTETVELTISNPSDGNVSIGTAAATANITDNDNVAGSINADLSVTTHGNETGPVNIVYTVTLAATNNTGSAITFDTSFSGGDGTAGSDYTDVSGAATISVADGAATGTLSFPVTNDSYFENTETAALTVSNASDAAININTASATANITDNDNTAGSINADLSVTTHGSETGPVSIVYTVTLAATNNTGTAITFDTSFSGGTAIAGSDYSDVSGAATISVADGSTTGTLSVPVTDDSYFENTETAALTVSNASDAAININTASATANIADNDNTAGSIDVDLSVTTHGNEEGPVNIVYTVTLAATNNTGTAITFDTSFSGGTAIAGSDYTDVSGAATISVADGSAIGTLSVPVTDDSDFENTETATLTISNASDAAININTASATANITDNDNAAGSIDTDLSVITHGNEEGPVNIVYTVTLSTTNNTGSAITFDTSFSGGTAIAGSDYTDVSGAATISVADDSATGTLSVPVTDDSDAEGTETVVLTISNASNPAININTASATANITDNDTIDADLSVTTHGDETGPVSIVYTITLAETNNTGSAITFDTSFSSGTATGGIDYTDVSGAATLSVADGSTTDTLSVPVTDDSDFENTETLEMTISNASYPAININTATATANITDSDNTAGSIDADLSVTTHGNETGPVSIVYTVTLATTNNTGTAITFDTSFSGGTAIAGSDYTDVSGAATLSVADGSTTGTLSVPVTDDSDFENTETAEVTISNASDAAININTATATANITDNDNVAGSINADLSVTTHGNETGPVSIVYTVTLATTNNTGTAITFDTSFSGGTAIAGSDYSDVSGVGTISVADGSATGTLSVPVTNDSDFENTETATLTISNASDAAININTASITANIPDNDNVAGSIDADLSVTTHGNETGPVNIVYTVTLATTNNTGSAITFDTSFSGGTAIAGSDYTDVSGAATISVADGSATGTFSVPVINDSDFENTETAQVTISNASDPAININTVSATANITDNDNVAGSINADLSVTTHGNETGPVSIVYTVTLATTNNTGSAITFDTSFSGGTAAAGSDYTDVSGAATISVADGSATGTLPVPVTDDSDLEGTQTVELTISNASDPAININTASATADITDDEAVTANLGATVQGNETSPVSIQYTVTLSDTNNTGSAVTFDFNTSDGTATAGSDYSAVSGVGNISVADGAATGTISVPVLDDALLEATETVDGTISNSSHQGVTIGTATAAGDILDDETATASLSSTRQGDETGLVTIQYTVVLSETNNSGSPITFDFDTSDGTATAGSDYTAVSGDSISVNNGAVTGTTTVTVLDDLLLEATETVNGTITNSSHAGVTIGTGTANGEILDDETATAALSTTTAGVEDPTTPTNIVYTVTLSKTNNTGSAITFDFNSSDNTAAADNDYTAISGGSISVADGATTGTIAVTVIDDSLLEITETVDGTISNSSNASMTIDTATATANILDDETATANLSATAQGDETGPVSIEYTVILSKTNNTGNAITFDFDTADNTATAGSDYTAVSDGSISVTDGATTGTITVTVLDDALLEATETVSGTITNSSHAGVAIGTGTANGDILDDETATASLSVTTNGVEDSTTPTNIVYTVTLSKTNNTGSAITFDFNTSDNTATTGSDYTAISGGSISVADGAATGTISVTVLDDSDMEGTETVDGTIGNSSSASVTISTATATADIADDEAATADLSATVQGNEDGPVTIQFTATLSRVNNTGSAITFDFNTADNTATADSDYTAVSGTANISVDNGSTTGTTTVTVLDDALLEATETVDGTISNASHPGVTIGTATAAGDILDDETATADLSATVQGDETGPVAIEYTVTLSLTNNTGSAITFDFDTADNTAVVGSDYTAVSGVGNISVADGANTGTITVPVLDDGDLEITETVDGTISNSSNASVTIDTATATGDILDDEAATVSIAATDAAAVESPGDNGQFTITMSQDNDTGGGLTVNYSIGGTAANGSDYVTLTGSVNISDGADTATVDVDVTGMDDSLFEGDETVILTLTGTGHSAVTAAGSPNDTASVTITDDDAADHNVTIEATDDEAIEELDNGVFTVILKNSSGTPTAVPQDIEVTFAVGGTAAEGTDYTAVGTTVTIAEGTSSTTVTIDTGIDTVVVIEGDETVELTLTDVDNNVSLGATTEAAVTIIEDIWPPVIQTVQVFDDDNDGDPGFGYLDRVMFTFDEDLEAGQEDLSDWALYDADGTTNLLAGLDDSAVTISGNTVTITLADNTGTDGNPFYLYKSDGDGGVIQDLYTNDLETVGNNNNPAAAAGDDVETLPRLVRLNASGSSDPDGNVLTYTWTQDDGPIDLGISGAEFEEVAFAGRAKGTYTFTVTAEDSFGAENEDTVLVTILNGKPAPKPGRNRAVDKDDDTDLDVVLEGCASRDPNSYTGYNDIVDYQWQWTSGPQEVTLTQDGSVQPLRVRPKTTEVVTRAGFDTSDLGPGAYAFTLTVTDADGLTGEANVEITVNDPGGNGIPVADAGMGMQQHIGSRIMLDGHESKDPDGDPLTYRWEQVSGPEVKILRANKIKAMVRPSKPGTYVFSLIVNDGQADSAPALVTVEMTDPRKPLPVAEIMVEGAVHETWQFAVGEEITLDGTVLGMDEGDVTPAWSQVRGTTLTIADYAIWDLLLSPVEEGVYVFRLDVSDDDAGGRGKEITVTVLGDSVPPVADAGDDQLEIMTGDLVTLDASGSYDDDPGDILDYTWTQLLGPAMQLSDPYLAQPTFTPEDTGACLFQLIVFDGDYESAPDLVYVVVHSEDEYVPTAKVVDDTITDGVVGNMVIMNGTPSVDRDSQDTLVYQWVQSGGAMIVLDDPYSAVPSFTPSLAGTYLFTLYVDDSRDRSVGQTVTVNVTGGGAVRQGTNETGPGTLSCFIATAAYGTPFENDVLVLRRFRDRFLLPSEQGRKLVELYYTYSPPAAEMIQHHEELRKLVRKVLSPVVRGIEMHVSFTTE